MRTGEDPALEAVAACALDLIEDGATVGLGSGYAAAAFVTRLAVRVQEGLRVAGVATSEAIAREARALGILLVALDDMDLDLTIDGADEVAPNLDLIKGWGGALVRERIVASASRRQVLLVGNDKLVRALGEHGRIPIEVIPLARGPVTVRLRSPGIDATVRPLPGGAGPLVTENGNLILDCAPRDQVEDGAAARALEATLLAIPGVVDTGLFLGTADRVIVGYANGRVDVLGGAG